MPDSSIWEFYRHFSAALIGITIAGAFIAGLLSHRRKREAGALTGSDWRSGFLTVLLLVGFAAVGLFYWGVFGERPAQVSDEPAIWQLYGEALAAALATFFSAWFFLSLRNYERLEQVGAEETGRGLKLIVQMLCFMGLIFLGLWSWGFFS